MCSRSFLEKTIPAVKWMRGYNKKNIIHDVIAGLTVGLTAIPQGIAYAVVAGLQPQYGLYAAFMGPFTYVLLGSCKDITIGPTAILALMTQTFVTSHGPDFAVLLAFLSGCIIFLLGLFRMGFLVDFISMPVTVGFTSAAAITIASSQLKGLFGFGGSSNDFIGACVNLVKHLHETRLWDSVLGMSTIVVLLLTKNLKDVYKGRNMSELSLWQRVLSQTLWMICVARNAIVVVLGALVAYILDSRGHTPFKLTGKITEGLPPFALPPFSSSNGTNYTFIDMVQEMGTSVAVVPLISILESVAIAKSFSKGKAVDATQEMIALGVGNILGSFVRSMPVTGSFTRTAVNNASGVCTQLGGAFTGLLILVALGFLTGTFYYIPKASLAGLIMCAMIFMVEYEMVPLLWKTKKLDLIPFFATFFGCLFIGLEYGILLGVGVNLVFILYESARPSVHRKELTINGNSVLLVRPENGLVFPAAEYIRDIIVRSCPQDDQLDFTIVVDGTHVFTVDATMAKNMQLLTVDLELRKQPVIFWNWRRTTEGTCCGLDPDMARYFRYGSTLHDLFKAGHVKVRCCLHSSNLPLDLELGNRSPNQNKTTLIRFLPLVITPSENDIGEETLPRFYLHQLLPFPSIMDVGTIIERSADLGSSVTPLLRSLSPRVDKKGRMDSEQDVFINEQASQRLIAEESDS
uniref:SLC26A/SulP transporter domain-containing protein n=1 Tax=Timema monikensis TaxID=170555 RepID=A0A7R9EHX9_9NEOP|nr:unnamed protein product [Timema monikensis]